MTEPLLSPEIFDRVLSSKEGSAWFSKLQDRARASGIEDPQAVEAAAKGEMRSRLSGLLENLAAKYQDIKLGALERITELQERASAFIDETLASKDAPPDASKLEAVLQDLDTELENLEKGIDEVHAEPQPGEATSARPDEATTKDPHRPKQEPAARQPNEKLRRRDRLTKGQARHFKEWKANIKAAIKKATKDKAGPEELARLQGELERARFEAKQTSLRNQNQPEYPSFEKYQAVVAARDPHGARGATATADAVRPGISEYVGKPLESGDRFPTVSKTGKAKRTRIDVEVTGVGPNGETITTRPDSITVGPDGKPDPSGVVHDHKTWRGGNDGVIGDDKSQLAAQRKYAADNGGRHVVSISSDVPPELDGVPPKPRPEDSVGEGSEVVFVDSNNKVSRVWSPTEKKWVVPRVR